VPFFDIAYQGFATGDPDNDAFAIRYFTELGFEMIVAQSLAKNFGLYGERIGAVHVVCPDPETARAVLSQIEWTIRPMYAFAPIHGATVVAKILKTPELN
jgi:aspartate/tyrosine/aromatic aminotransferase